MAIDYDDHAKVINLLQKAQDADHDNRNKTRAVTLFLDKDDGQWEPGILRLNRESGKPTYTFDKCNPIVDSIASSIEQSDFIVKVAPAGGDSTQEIAETYDGLIRNIQNISNASDIYNSASRSVISAGLGGWRVVQDWLDSPSFDQDLLIKPISNYVDRIWFGPAELPDQSDAQYVFDIKSISTDEYRERWPNGSGTSVGQDRDSDAYRFKFETIEFGEILYKKPTTIELVLMSNDAVYSVDDEFDSIVDELAAAGITEVRRRKRDTFTVHQRFFDGKDWLSEEKETVFNLLPIVPMFGNFKISENKVTYWGAVNHLLDAQRVYNYARSRQIEEGALSPREKFMMTPEQMKNHKDSLATMNVNADPVQPYNHVEGQPAPYLIGGYKVNEGLEVTAQSVSQDINAISGQFGANMADNPRFQSGEAIDLQQKAGNANNLKYYRSAEVARTLTCKILIGAIPKVYDQERQLRIVGEDGVDQAVAVNQRIQDEQTGEIVTLNDLSQGTYDVTCKSGTSFSNRQDQTVKAITELAAIDPTLIQENGDILYKNMDVLGGDDISERKRLALLLRGGIPQTQQAPEEQEMLAQMQAQQQAQGAEGEAIDQANLMIAQAEQTKADAEQQKVLILQQKAEIEIQEKQLKLNLDGERLQLEREKLDAQVANNQQKNAISQQEQQLKELQAISDRQSQQINDILTSAQASKTLREAQGVDTIVGPHAVEATINSFDMTTELQDEVNPDLAGEEIVGDSDI